MLSAFRTLKAAGTALAVVFAASTATAETLTDALVGAYRSSGLLEQQRALLRATDEDVAQAAARLRPVLDYAAGVRWSDPLTPGSDRINGTVGLDASWLLYDFGATRFGIEARKEAVLAARSALTSAEQAVLLRAVSAYVGVLRAQAFVDLNQSNEQLIREQLRAAQDRFEVGEVTRTDVSLAEASLAAAQASVAAEQGNLVAAREAYKAVVGRYPGALQPVSRVPDLPANEDAAREIARQTHPDILEAQRNVRVAELQIRQAEQGLLPALQATAGTSFNDSGDRTSSAGLSLGGPIYRGGALASAVRQAKARRDGTRGALLNTVRIVEQNLGTDWATLRVAVARREAASRGTAAAQLALDGLREELQLGARTTLDVLDQRQSVLDAQTNRVSAEFDRVIAAYDILESLGLLTVEHLRLPVVSYDPSAYYTAVDGAPVVDVSPQGERLDHVLKRIGRN